MKRRAKNLKTAKYPPLTVSYSPKVHPALKHYTGYCLHKASIRLRAMFDEKLVQFGVIAPQYGILAMLNVTGSITQVELGTYMIIDKATMVRMIDVLENKKYLTRIIQEKDRRSKRLQITSSGIKVLEKMNALRAEVEQDFLSILSEQERAQIKDILFKLV